MHVFELGGDRGHRRWCLVFETDDPVVERLRAFAREEDVRAAHLTALGAFREATLAFFDWETKEYQELPVGEQVEVTSLVGDLSRGEEGTHEVHVHCVLGRPDGSAVTGHLLEARVRPTLEVFVHEGKGELVRRHDPESGLDLIRP